LKITKFITNTTLFIYTLSQILSNIFALFTVVRVRLMLISKRLKSFNLFFTNNLHAGNNVKLMKIILVL